MLKYFNIIEWNKYGNEITSSRADQMYLFELFEIGLFRLVISWQQKIQSQYLSIKITFTHNTLQKYVLNFRLQCQ